MQWLSIQGSLTKGLPQIHRLDKGAIACERYICECVVHRFTEQSFLNLKSLTSVCLKFGTIWNFDSLWDLELGYWSF
jgi:hypothetical protein